MSEHEAPEAKHPQWLDTFTLYDPMDRLVLLGAEKAARAEKMLIARKEARENLQGIDQSDAKDSFTGSATIFKNPDGSLYAMVYTDWVEKDGQATGENTSWGEKVPITQDQLQILREAREAHNQKDKQTDT